MSGSAEKASRREIRRAFGVEAVDAITSRDQAINKLQAQIHAMDVWAQRAIEAHRQELDRLWNRPYPVTFWQRVKWLVSGRA